MKPLLTDGKHNIVINIVWKFERGFDSVGVNIKMSVSKTVFVESFHFHFDENLHFIFSNFYFASSVKSADHRGELVKEMAL